MPNPRPIIERLEISGFKSLRQASIDFTKLNVLIGPNGAGKSNLISLFALLRAGLHGKLYEYFERHGGPNAFLYLGAKQTNELSIEISMNSEAGRAISRQRIGFRPPDSIFHSGTFEALLTNDGKLTPSGRVETYHFHDTSLAAQIRSSGYIEDNKTLHGDGGNLAAMLCLYREKSPGAYRRVVRSVQKVLPHFDDFALEPQRLNPKNILLNWKQKGSDYLFGPHQLPDGTLRAIALFTLFLQPDEDLPNLIVLDEPELGLHPHALEIVAGLIRAASTKTQVIVATQSQAFLEHFEPAEIIVVESRDGCSQFRRLDAADLQDWLDDYSIGELWEKNVIGGGPLS